MPMDGAGILGERGNLRGHQTQGSSSLLDGYSEVPLGCSIDLELMKSHGNMATSFYRLTLGRSSHHSFSDVLSS